jgi:hypothetical protein
VLVVVDVFSGRENPSWEPSPEECQGFIRKFHSLQELKQKPLKAEELGYRGIIVIGPPAEIGDYEEINVSAGAVFARKGTELHYFDDSGHELELWLLQTGRGKFDDPLYQSIVKQIEGKSSQL